jgi:hypothetical protein
MYLTPRRIAPKFTDPSLVLCDWKDVARAIRSALLRDASAAFNRHAVFQLAEHFDHL